MSLALRALIALFVMLAGAGLAQAQQPAEEAALHARRRPGRRQALRDLPQGQLAAQGQCRASCAPKATGLLAAGTDPRAAARAYAQAVVFDANDVRLLDRARPRAARHQARPGQRALRSARQRLRRRLDRLRAGADAGRQGRRAGGAARGAEAPLLLAPGHRRAESEPRAGRGRAGARGLRQAGGRARLPHRSSTRSRPTRPSRACASSSPSAWRPARSTGRSTSRSTARTRRR